MVQLILDIAVILLSASDAQFTKRKLEEFGPDAELNPVIRWLAKRIGLNWGVDIGIALPTFIWAAAGLYCPMLLAFITGTKFTLFIFQRRSVLFSK